MKLTHSPRFALIGCAAALFAAVDTQAARTKIARINAEPGAEGSSHANTTVNASHSPHAGGSQQLNIGGQGGVQTSAKKFGTCAALNGEGSALGTIDAAALAIDDSAAAGTRLLQ